MSNSVYALVDGEQSFPLNPIAVRYVGISSQPETRFRQHLAEKKVNYKTNWQKGAEDLRMIILEDGLSRSEAMLEEIRLISAFKRAGSRLTNRSDGGDRGRKPGKRLGYFHKERITASSRKPEVREAKAKHMRLRAPKGEFKGVRKVGSRFIAMIKVGSSPSYLGSFKEATDAAKAYDRVAHESWGKECFLNFPDDFQ